MFIPCVNKPCQITAEDPGMSLAAGIPITLSDAMAPLDQSQIELHVYNTTGSSFSILPEVHIEPTMPVAAAASE